MLGHHTVCRVCSVCGPVWALSAALLPAARSMLGNRLPCADQSYASATSQESHPVQLIRTARRWRRPELAARALDLRLYDQRLCPGGRHLHSTHFAEASR